MTTDNKSGNTVVFDGVMFCWKTKASLDVVIVFHSAYDVYEVIVYNSVLNKEAPRVYLCCKTLFSMIGHDEVANKLSLLERTGAFVTDTMIADATNKVVSEFVLARLLLSETNQVTVHIHQHDKVSSVNSSPFLMCPKLPALKEFKTKHIS